MKLQFIGDSPRVFWESDGELGNSKCYKNGKKIKYE